jgi:integrase/recombinase XerD
MEFLSGFEDYMLAEDMGEQTVRSYLFDVQKFQRWYQDTTDSEISLDCIGPLDISEFRRYLQTLGQKPNTINRALAALSALFTWAVKEKYATGNPTTGVKKIKEVGPAPKALSRRDQLSLMRAAQAGKKPRDISLMTLLLHTGLRVSEVRGLDLDDIDLRERSGSVGVRHGKGNKYRRVPLNATARSAVRDWLLVRGNSPGPLFRSQKKQRISSRAIERMIAKYAYLAKLEDVTPHTLRHTFCKSLVDRGESIDRVAMLAGHEDLNTTAKYTRATDSDLQKSVDKLDWE